MATKKPAAAKKTAARPKRAVSDRTTTPAVSPVSTTAAADGDEGAFKHAWTLPTAMLMLIIAAGGLWLAVRESSNAPQAATPSAVHDTPTDIAAPPPHKSGAPNAAATANTSATPAGTAPAAQSKPVSITGCLQHAGDGYVLKNADGAAVSKTRSWKSGFLKRSSPSVDLLDAGNAAHLGSHVGQRVSVSGPLTDGEMQVQSLRRVAATCQ